MLAVKGQNVAAEIEIRRGAGGDSAYVRGSRVRVSDIARLIHLHDADQAIECVQDALPFLTRTQIKAAIAWWHKHEDDVEQEIAEEAAILRATPSGA
jgi:uncharacterized protein (DUF433 family)